MAPATTTALPVSGLQQQRQPGRSSSVKGTSQLRSRDGSGNALSGLPSRDPQRGRDRSRDQRKRSKSSSSRSRSSSRGRRRHISKSYQHSRASHRSRSPSPYRTLGSDDTRNRSPVRGHKSSRGRGGRDSSRSPAAQATAILAAVAAVVTRNWGLHVRDSRGSPKCQAAGAAAAAAATVHARPRAVAAARMLALVAGLAAACMPLPLVTTHVRAHTGGWTRAQILIS